MKNISSRMGSTNRELFFTVRALNIAGFILQMKGRVLMFLVIWFLFVYSQYFIIHVFAVIHFLLEPVDLARSLLTMFLIINGAQTIFKHFYFAYNRDAIANLLDMFDHNPIEDGPKSLQMLDIGMRLQSRKHTKRFGSVILLYNVASYFIAVLTPIASNAIKVYRCNYEGSELDDKCNGVHASFIYEFWWPTDPKALPTYFYLIIWQLFMVIVFISTNCTVDTFGCSLMLAAAERCSMLARSAPQALQPGPGGQITPNMKAWSKYHQHYLKLVANVNKVMGPLLLMIHTFAAFNIIVYLYFIIKFHDPKVVQVAISMLGAFIIQIFIYAIAGQKILNTSKDLTTATLSAASHLTDDGIQTGPALSCLQILSARCSGSMPETFNGMGIFVIGFDLFVKVMSASLTYLLVIIQLCNCTGRVSYNMKQNEH